MVDLVALTNAMAQTLANIPELMALLDQGIDPYIDMNADRNSVAKAIYKQPAGSLLVVWQSATLDTQASTMEGYVHVIQIYIKAMRGNSALAIVTTLLNGIPVPGDGLIWRRCGIMDGVLPTQVSEVVRLIDPEGIDYIVATTLTQEIGDADTPPSSASAEGE